jgi:hypothetical protein
VASSSEAGTVNQDGVVLLGGTEAKRELTRIVPGGAPEIFRKALGPDSTPGFPYFLRDGRWYLFAKAGAVYLTSLDRPQTAPRRVALQRASCRQTDDTYIALLEP